MKKIMGILNVIILLMLIIGLSSCEKPHEHEYGAGEIIEYSTCTQKGTIEFKCNICNEVKKESIKKLDHEYVNEKCVFCGKFEASDEKNVPGDENMDLAIRFKERRTLPSIIYADNNEKEKQYWDLQIYLHLKDQNAIYQNVIISTEIQKRDGTTKYEEKTVKILTGLENDAQIDGSTTDRGCFLSYAITSKAMVFDANTGKYTKEDGTPEKVFVKVEYEIADDNNVEKKTFSYRCDLIKPDELNFDEFKETTIDENQCLILNNNINDILKVKVRTELDEDTSKMDTYRLNVTYNPLKDDKKVIRDATIALFLKTKNTESDTEDYFSNYIEFAQYYGSLPYLYTIPQIATAFNGAIDIDDLYVYARTKSTDGIINESEVSISIDDLPVY